MKLGFIAMSGVRCRKEKLIELGRTLPGFVQRSKVIASLPSLGLLTLAGLTPENWETTYIEVADLKEVENLPGNFDLVAIWSFRPDKRSLRASRPLSRPPRPARHRLPARSSSSTLIRL